MKPMHSKPFDIAHAQAGAPFSFDDGESAEVIKWDRPGRFPLVVLRGETQEVFSMSSIGYGSAGQLVMLPLGEIDGKPFFIGDDVVNANGVAFKINWYHVGIQGCTWPTPAKVYPTSKMSVDMLCSSYFGDEPVAVNSMAEMAAYQRIANAAIKHAIDAGQVVIAVDPDQVFIAEVKK